MLPVATPLPLRQLWSVLSFEFLSPSLRQVYWFPHNMLLQAWLPMVGD